MSEARWPRVAVGGIVVEQGRILLVRRAHAPDAGLWSIPGGSVEWGETLCEAVRREVREECGVAVKVHELLWLGERLFRGSDGSLTHHFVIADYRCRILGPEAPVAGSDAASLRWFRREELSEGLLAHGLHEVLQQAQCWREDTKEAR